MAFTDDGHWEWTANKDRAGYGLFWHDGERRAHRWAYEYFVGPIPQDLVIDHLCRNTSCVNPNHLEPVTNKENVLRGEGFAARNAKLTHCPQGHPYDEKNTRWKRVDSVNAQHRQCRQCGLDRNKAARLALVSAGT